MKKYLVHYKRGETVKDGFMVSNIRVDTIEADDFHYDDYARLYTFYTVDSKGDYIAKVGFSEIIKVEKDNS